MNNNFLSQVKTLVQNRWPDAKTKGPQEKTGGTILWIWITSDTLKRKSSRFALRISGDSAQFMTGNWSMIVPLSTPEEFVKFLESNVRTTLEQKETT